MSQLNNAVRAPPTCSEPVGDGAKRTRTAPAGGAGGDASICAASLAESAIRRAGGDARERARALRMVAAPRTTDTRDPRAAAARPSQARPNIERRADQFAGMLMTLLQPKNDGVDGGVALALGGPGAALARADLAGGAAAGQVRGACALCARAAARVRTRLLSARDAGGAGR